MCECCEGHRKVQVHLVDGAGKPKLITYGENASLTDVAQALNVPVWDLGVMVVRSPLSVDQSHPDKLHRVYQGDQISSGRGVIEELL